MAPRQAPGRAGRTAADVALRDAATNISVPLRYCTTGSLYRHYHGEIRPEINSLSGSHRPYRVRARLPYVSVTSVDVVRSETGLRVPEPGWPRGLPPRAGGLPPRARAHWTPASLLPGCRSSARSALFRVLCSAPATAGRARACRVCMRCSAAQRRPGLLARRRLRRRHPAPPAVRAAVPCRFMLARPGTGAGAGGDRARTSGRAARSTAHQGKCRAAGLVPHSRAKHVS